MQSVLALSLGIKGGSIIYGTEIINHFSLPSTVIIAKDSSAQPTVEHQEWKAHRNSREFFLYSVTLLPFYILKISFNLLRGKYSALYLPYLHFWSIFFIVLFKIFRKRVIITVHDGVLHGKNRTIPGIQYLTNSCIKLADELIFLSEYVLEGVKFELNPAGNFHLIPHGLIIPDRILNIHTRKHSSKPTILFFGKVLVSKGIENLVKACSLLEQESYDCLYIIGKHYYPLQIETNSAKIKIIDRFISEQQIAEYFNQANILVLPYTEASQSGVVTIGIAACLPMVCTNIGGLKEQLVAEKESIFVEPNPEAIRDGILRLIEDRNLYENISCHLKQKHNDLQWSEISAKVQAVISNSRE